MEDDYGSNFYADLKKVPAFWSVRFRVSALERFIYKGFFLNLSIYLTLIVRYTIPVYREK